MNEKGVSYPSVMIDPGSYGGRIFMNGRALPGTIELQADSVVTAEFYDEEAFKKPGGYPQDSQLDQLVGQLWQNHHVVLRGVQLMEVFPGRYVARAKYALVGLNPEAIEGSFTRMEVQVEGLNEFFYAPPLAEFSWSHQTPGEFAATTAEGTEASWSSDGLDISAGYPWNIEHQEGYRLHVSFVPALEANSGESLSPDDWIRLWLRPLTRLISFSTGAIRRPTWVMFSNNADPPEWVPRAQLFGSGISQHIYDAARPESRHPGDRPLFTKRDLPSPLPDLISRWRDLETSDNPFPELYRLASIPDLPARARFLYLVQALEGLHGFEHRDEDSARKTRYEARRNSLISDVASAVQANTFSRRLKDMIGNRPPDDLGRRIRAILDVTPSPVLHQLVASPDDPIVQHYAADGKIAFEELIRRLRNDLSHGNYSPDSRDLNVWTERLGVIGRAQMLRLLGFSSDLVTSRLGHTPPSSTGA